MSSDFLSTERLTIVLTMACISSNRVCARVVQEKLYQLLANNKNTIYQQTRNQFTAAGTIYLTNRIANQYNGFNFLSGKKQVIIHFPYALQCQYAVEIMYI